MEDWTEKYRPKSLSDVVGNDIAVLELRKWADSWKRGKPQYKAIVLSGRAGIGKTSSAMALARDYNWPIIELNTSDARNAEKIKSVATVGSINETFDNQGRFISSKSGGRKLIILDEADNLYEKRDGMSSEFSDSGGKKAIIETVRYTNQPIILIVNDYYGLVKGGGEVFKILCKQIKFYNPKPFNVANLLKKISLKEEIHVDPKVINAIADRCNGDIRSALNDLQSISLDKKQIDEKALASLGYRDRESDIFAVMREIFKTKNLRSIRRHVLRLDQDPNQVLLWLNENIPQEYKDFSDLANGYDSLSKADVFLGRTVKRQNYRLWAYSSDLMNGGVATAKTRNYPNTRYNFPTWLKQSKSTKSNREIRDSILKKISKECHNSNRKSKDYFTSYFKSMFIHDIDFAIKMKQKLNFSESEVGFLLGKENQGQLNEILSEKKVVKEKLEEKNEDIGVKEAEKEENLQQSLLDF